MGEKDLRVVYVPDVTEYALTEIEAIKPRSPGDAKLDRIRRNYSSLEKVVDIPNRVGVSTLHGIQKVYSLNETSELRTPENQYPPLVVLDEVLKLRHAPNDTNIDTNFIYRSLSRIVGENAYLFEGLLQSIEYLGLIPCIPGIRSSRDQCLELLELFGGRDDLLELRETVSEIRDRLDKFISFDDVQELRDKVKSHFDKNRVSSGFPLHYLPNNDYTFRMFYEVDLSLGIEEPDFLPRMRSLIQDGVKSSDFDSMPAHVQKELDSYKRDRYAETREIDSFGNLVLGLPEPKTVITDIYLVDHFPKLEGRFKSYEVRLDENEVKS